METEIWSAAEEWIADYDNNDRAAINYYFTTALSALKMGDVEKARQNLDNLMETPESKERDIQINQIKGLLLIEEGNADEGIKLLRETAVTESELPVDFGPPVIVKPSYELLAEVMMEMEDYEQALVVYEKQLQRTPKRMRSVVGKKQALEAITK